MLTSFGASQLREVGSRLRDKYINQYKLLPPFIHNPSSEQKEVSSSRASSLDISSGKLFARCSNLLRTVQSAQNLLLGLYPEESRAKGTLIPIHTQEIGKETLFPQSSCRRSKDIINSLEQQRQHANPLYKTRTKEIEQLLRTSCGIPDRQETVPFEHLRDSLNCWAAHNLSLPPLVNTNLVCKNLSLCICSLFFLLIY